MRACLLHFSLLTLLASGCGPEEKPSGADTGPVGTDGDADTDADTDTDTDADTDTDTDACSATITGLSPGYGTTGVPIDEPVVATFSEAVTAATITMNGGVTGTTVLADGGLTATFTPDALLERDTEYTATAHACDSALATQFTTLGAALDIDLTERTYAIQLDDSSDLTWVEPAIGSFLAGQIETNSILFMVEAADADQIDIVGAAGYDRNGGVLQYPCTYALDFDPSSFVSNPYFSIGPVDAEMETSGVAFSLYGLTMDGTFSEDGDEAQDLLVTGLLDVRPLSEMFEVDACELVAGFGDACTACPDGEIGCLVLEVQDEVAPWLEDTVLDKDIDPTADVYCY